jgi:2,4-dienoyl-CoA reductase-like NADH-dependent reductase (Old Yellow Enzyme family)/NADPH-dependent 2,4-dienoyl-CoA reductase/sulfur reductase-like enzyme
MTPVTDYPHVFSPLKIGNITLKNRIEAAPMLSCLDSEGLVSKELVAYFQAFARGGAAIVTIGDSTIDYLNGRFHNGELNLGDDRIIGGLSVFAEAIQRYGAKASIEVNHAGMIAATQPGVRPIGPMTMTFTFRDHPYPVLGLTKGMIEELIDRYAAACERAVKAGLDMVMIHGGHGWMPALFASTMTNQRTDEYGGSLENRARFAIELLTEVRRRVGDKLAIEYRISAEELAPGGMKIDETIEFIKLIQDKIDLIHVSTGVVGEPKYGMWSQPVYYSHNYIVPFAEMVKKELAIPVTTVGSIMTVADAEEIIATGKADVVAMARALIADPELVNKSFHGKVDDIRPCTRCCKCLDRPAFFFPVRCAVNPVVGRELEYRTIPRAELKKTVVVVGGGPAGMQAALTASERGHKVILFEKEQSLGGAMRPASGLPFKYDLRKYMDWVAKKTLGSGVDVQLGVEATPDLVRAERPDALIVAVGAEPNTLGILVHDNAPVLSAGDVDAGAETGDRVVVVGGGLVGCETALSLAMAGKGVTIVDILVADRIAEAGGLTTRAMLLAFLEDNGVELLTETTVEAVREDAVIAVGKGGERIELPADSVIMATGYHARHQVAESFRGSAYDVFYVGDCRKAENILTAVHSGFNVAVEI